jgi:hypothetical protein
MFSDYDVVKSLKGTTLKFLSLFGLILFFAPLTALASSTTYVPIQLPMPSQQSNVVATTYGDVVTMPDGRSFTVTNPGLKVGKTKYQFEISEQGYEYNSISKDDTNTPICQLFRPRSKARSSIVQGFLKADVLVAKVSIYGKGEVLGVKAGYEFARGNNYRTKILNCRIVEEYEQVPQYWQ